MYEIDPSRSDLVREFEANPDGPHSPELTLVVNRLRLMPIEDRHVIVCTKRGREWAVAKMPARGGARLQISEGQKFDDYTQAVLEVFRRRWKTVTGSNPA